MCDDWHLAAVEIGHHGPVGSRFRCQLFVIIKIVEGEENGWTSIDGFDFGLTQLGGAPIGLNHNLALTKLEEGAVLNVPNIIVS